MTRVAATSYVSKQLESFFPDGGRIGATTCFELAYDRTIEALRQLRMFRHIEEIDVLNSIQYPVFLYKLSRTLYSAGDRSSATKVFYLNKALHAVDLFYEVELGDCFTLGHAVGSVFCKTSYGTYLVFHQGVLVGRNGDDRPRLGDGLVMFPGSRIIGNCTVGENVVLSAGVTVVNHDIPSNVFVFTGENGMPLFKDLEEYYADRFFLRDGK